VVVPVMVAKLPKVLVPSPKAKAPVGAENEPYPASNDPDGPWPIAGLRNDPDDEAGLVTELRRSHAVHDLKRLHRSRRQLIRIDATLLVGDRLVVHRVLRLGVVAHRMEEAVGVRGDAGGGAHHDRVQACGRLDGRRFDDALIQVHVHRGSRSVRAAPTTSTDVVWPASFMARSSSIGTPPRTSTSRSTGSKPVADALTWYGVRGGGREGELAVLVGPPWSW